MVSKTVTLINSQGLHMRPAGTFASAMGKYKSEVIIKYNGSEINGKSLMNILMSCIKCGSTVDVVCSGSDEQSALDEAVSLIESGLGE